MLLGHIAIWSITLLSIACMLMRPRNIPEVWWVGGGALLLTLTGLISLHRAGHAVAEGTDVYLFLAGMMLLSEFAQRYGVFDWLASAAINHARGSRTRLFLLIYGVGALVTVFMSNDATAVVLTPAVLSAVKKSKAEPLPYLFICAFVANAASFVLPISNPANLVVFHGNMPSLGHWLRIFLVPSALAILATFGILRWYCREDLQGEMEATVEQSGLSANGRLVLAGIGLTAVVLLIASSLGGDLGAPTLGASLMVGAVLLLRERSSPMVIVREVSWSILPLVAALFILVEAVNGAGALGLTQQAMHVLESCKPLAGALAAAFGAGVGTNLVNNLPLGLITGAGIDAAHITGALRNAMLIGIDLGPNLSVTGSLATILWLMAIRKEGMHVGAWKFFKLGLVAMPPALLLAAASAALLKHAG